MLTSNGREGRASGRLSKNFHACLGGSQQVGEELGSWIMAGFAHERIECYMPMIAFKKFRVLNDSLDRAIYHCLSTGSEFRVTGDT